MAVEATGRALRRSHSGTFDVDFALRYEPSDQTIRAYQLNFQNLRISALRPLASDLLNAYEPAMADSLGLQPGSITVTDKGLVIGFVLKCPCRVCLNRPAIKGPRPVDFRRES